MHAVILLCLVGVLASAAADDIDVLLSFDPEPYLNDETKWKVIFDCFMERAPCGELQGVKDAELRLYANKCEKCTPEQKEKFENLMKRFADKYPKDYVEVINKYAPKPE